ncbi:MAG: sensor histidine kinase, partial [Oscillospiraceae bacterium]
MKKAKFQTKLIFYNVLIFLIITVLVMGLFYYYLVNNISKRMIADFEALANKSAGQMNTLIYNMDKTALQIAANPTVVNYFNAIPKDKDTNYFINEPLVSNEIIKLLNSYNFKKDGNSRVCLYNDSNDFVYSATTMTTSTAVADFFNTDTFKQTQKYFENNNAYSLFKAPKSDILNDSLLPSPSYIAIVREIKDYFTGIRKNGYVEVQQDVA